MDDIETASSCSRPEKTIAAEHRFRVLRILDESMQPLLLSGTLLVVDLDATPELGNIVLVCMSPVGEKIGRLVQHHGKPCLKAANPEFPLIPLESHSCISGVVTQAMVSLD